MRRATLIVSLVLVGALLLAGCGGDATHATVPTATTTVTSQPTAAARLEAAVRSAIRQAHRVSVEVLQTNQVPANAQASGGPALATLRRSAAERRKAGVRVRVLSEHFRILSVDLDPSYAAATATVLDDERVQPTYIDGRPRGKAVTLDEHAHLDLRRVQDTERFKVWKVGLLP